MFWQLSSQTKHSLLRRVPGIMHIVGLEDLFLFLRTPGREEFMLTTTSGGGGWGLILSIINCTIEIDDQDDNEYYHY